ncbi:MAG TPA: sugar O-acetyltransferase [Candidatus Coproplasma stercoravium]|nr:sugar O-acetyltransferase [Candidatus Coproplasma stercoravium]
MAVRGEYIGSGSERHIFMHSAAQRAIEITGRINGGYHSPAELRALFSELVGQKVDEGFGLFPPFYTDYGRNIRVGKRVFINSGCCFQDQGGIELGDGCLIGHQVVIATLNHDLDPNKRGSMIPAKVTLGKNVWVGAHATILPGVKIGDNAVIAAGAVVSRDVPENTVVAGVPARVIKRIV